MRRHLPKVGADLRMRLGDLERRLALLEQSRPRLRLVDGAPPAGEAPSWPHLPRRPRVPHPLLIAVFAARRGDAAYRRGAEVAARPLVDRVA